MNNGFLQSLTQKGWVQNPDGSWSRHPVARLETAQPQPVGGRALDEKPQAQGGGKAGLGRRAQRLTGGGIEVHLVAFVRRALDDDNLIGGMKPLRDAVCSTLGVDDGDPRVIFRVSQVPAYRSREGTVVRITPLP